ncbi:hypothetical protein DAD186_17860 [Dermabacter vaginalis]|uniref:Uncharacterized protein n=1 Tax=Dermabacter vaginalis TaxID=1630135 RepID=A0A1B0ZK61_9MICO|nr:hypothetical protein DAD186_17860 [Dermabacter vaginalis]
MGVAGIPLAVVWAMVTNTVTNGEGYKQMGAQSCRSWQ